MSDGLRILLHAGDPIRRRGLATMIQAAGHVLVTEAPDVVLCDLGPEVKQPGEAEAPVIVLADTLPAGEPPAGILPRAVTAEQLDPALRAVAAGLVVRAPGLASNAGFEAASEDTTALLTPREAQILTRVGQGMSNKAVARALGISVHTVKFHMEALFAKLDATSRAEAVAKGLRGGVIEL